jgi:glutaminyl-peptide cyclotransferase
MPDRISRDQNRIGGIFYLLLAGVILVSGMLIVGMRTHVTGKNRQFDGERAYRDVQIQVSYGARLPGSPAHDKTLALIKKTLHEAGWQVAEQRFLYGKVWNTNLRADYGPVSPLVILGAHYDSRRYADRDPTLSNRLSPVPGANDGASGVAVLLEIGRILPPELAKHTSLVFFDAEDNGGIHGWDWIAGSRAFVDALQEKPEAVIILDMVGDRHLNIYQEKNSNPGLTEQIWKKAADLGYEQTFIAEPKYRMLDDHLPFVQAGIPAVDIIDFDYPAWHTLEDTVDQVSPTSLQIVGEVVLAWLEDFISQRGGHG